MSSAWPRGCREGNTPSGWDLPLGRPGLCLSCQPACQGPFVQPVLPSSAQTAAFCSRWVLPSGCRWLISSSFSGYRSWTELTVPPKRQIRSLVWVCSVFFPPFNLGVCVGELGSRLTARLVALPDDVLQWNWGSTAKGSKRCPTKLFPCAAFCKAPGTIHFPADQVQCSPLLPSWEAPPHPPVQDWTVGAPSSAVLKQPPCSSTTLLAARRL